MRGNVEPDVSVIIPTFREGKFISGLLSRLVRVNYPLEIIVVDSGSEDGTVEKAKHFTDKVYEIDERGISKAKNYGAHQSSGEVLIFLDADVTLSLDFVEKTLDAFRDREVLGATCRIMPLRPRVTEQVFFLFYNRLIQFFSVFKPHSRGEFFAVRRKAFMKTGGFNERLTCVEDHDLAFRVSKMGRFVFISGLTVYESMRRIRKKGLFKVVKMWFANYLYFVMLRRTISKVWTPVR